MTPPAVQPCNSEVTVASTLTMQCRTELETLTAEYVRSGWRHLEAAYAFVPNAIWVYAYPDTPHLKQILQTRSNRAHHKGACHFRNQKRYLVSGTYFDLELFVSIYWLINQLHSSVVLYNDVPASWRRCADLGARSLFDKSCLAREKIVAQLL